MFRKLFILIILIFVSCTTLFSDVPKQVNYQGRLTDISGAPVADGTYSMIFKIYNIEEGDNGIPCGHPDANCLWEESQNVDTKNGIFNVMLGSINPLILKIFTQEDRWLGIAVESDGEMNLRQKFASSAYSITSAKTLLHSGTRLEVPSAGSCDSPFNWDHIDGFWVDADTFKNDDVIEIKFMAWWNDSSSNFYPGFNAYIYQEGSSVSCRDVSVTGPIVAGSAAASLPSTSHATCDFNTVSLSTDWITKGFFINLDGGSCNSSMHISWWVYRIRGE